MCSRGVFWMSTAVAASIVASVALSAISDPVLGVAPFIAASTALTQGIATAVGVAASRLALRGAYGRLHRGPRSFLAAGVTGVAAAGVLGGLVVAGLPLVVPAATVGIGALSAGFSSGLAYFLLGPGVAAPAQTQV